MKKILLTFFVLSGVLFALDWVKDIDSAVSQAKKEHKSIMVMVEGKHCRWCTKMKSRTLSDNAVQKRLEKFVVVKVMRENEIEMSKLPSVKGVPTIFFMKENGIILEEIIGFFNTDDFTYYINAVEKKTK